MNPTAVPIDDTLANLGSPDWTVVRDAVERIVELLKRGLDATSLAGVARMLVAVSEHDKWEVRRAVAIALQHLRHESYELVLARLLEDDNADVKAAANRTLVRRTELVRGDIPTDEDDLLQSWLAPIGKVYGRRPMLQAKRAATKYADLFVGQALHEIVKVISPLSTSLVNLSTELRLAEIDRKKCARHARNAHAQLRLLDSITKSLRKFTADLTPEFVRVELRRLLNDAHALVKSELERGRIALELTVARSIELDADYPHLVLALSNIIQNGFEAFEGITRKGRIRVEADVREQHVFITVTDNGRGMTEEALHDAVHLFSTSKGPGRGFGLPFARKIIEGEHRGSLEMTSAPGEGTTVTVMLPIEQEES